MGIFSIFKRGSKIAESNINAGLDTLEDPVKMTEQTIRDLDEELIKAINGEAQVRANELGKRADAAKADESATTWAKKAGGLQDRIDGRMLEQNTKTDELIGIALGNQQEAEQTAARLTKEADSIHGAVVKMDSKIKELKATIDHAKDDLGRIKSDMITNKVMLDVNKQLSTTGLDNAKNMLKKMREKTDAQANLGQAYADMGDETADAATKIDKVLGQTDTADLLAKFKENRNKK